jgi:uncharacterized protein (DUF1684 family)
LSEKLEQVEDILEKCESKLSTKNTKNTKNQYFAVYRQNKKERISMKEEIESFRVEKDNFFKNSSQSPLEEEDKKKFSGLKYFPVDLKYRFVIELKKYDKPENLTIVTSTGEERPAFKIGYFEFEIDGKKFKLQAYKFVDRKTPDDYVFVPFTDLTTGKETYEAGRYLDLHKDDYGKYILDFNLAYNPYCEYNEHYSCPIPPKENRLDVAIKSGEKRYK